GCWAFLGAVAAPMPVRLQHLRQRTRADRARLFWSCSYLVQMTARAGPAVCAQDSSFIVGRRTTTAHRGRLHLWVAQGVGASSAGALRPFRRYENESGDHSPQTRITLDGDLACIVRKI